MAPVHRFAHRALYLQEAAHEVVAIDNLVNSSEESLHPVAEPSGKTAAHTTDAVIDFAGLTAVGASASNRSSTKTTSWAR